MTLPREVQPNLMKLNRIKTNPTTLKRFEEPPSNATNVQKNVDTAQNVDKGLSDDEVNEMLEFVSTAMEKFAIFETRLRKEKRIGTIPTESL